MSDDTNNLTDALKSAARLTDIVLSQTQLQRLAQYARLLNKWNKVFSLTASGDITSIINTHIVDGLSIIKPIEQVIATLGVMHAEYGIIKILDVGSGMGIPGVVLAIMSECFAYNTILDALDSNSKKSAFLTQVGLELVLPNFHAINSRIESFGIDSKLRYNIIISRAFSSIFNTLNYVRHLVYDDQITVVLFMKSQKINDELYALNIDNQLHLDTCYYVDESVWPRVVRTKPDNCKLLVYVQCQDVSVDEKVRYIVQLKYIPLVQHGSHCEQPTGCVAISLFE